MVLSVTKSVTNRYRKRYKPGFNREIRRIREMRNANIQSRSRLTPISQSLMLMWLDRFHTDQLRRPRGRAVVRDYALERRSVSEGRLFTGGA